jgi:hypothetical protein
VWWACPLGGGGRCKFVEQTSGVHWPDPNKPTDLQVTSCTTELYSTCRHRTFWNWTSRCRGQYTLRRISICHFPHSPGGSHFCSAIWTRAVVIAGVASSVDQMRAHARSALPLMRIDRAHVSSLTAAALVSSCTSTVLSMGRTQRITSLSLRKTSSLQCP